MKARNARKALVAQARANSQIFGIYCAESLASDFDESFHKSIRPITCFVQFLFLMPVRGVSRERPSDLAFEWMSLRVVATLVYILYGVALSALYLHCIHTQITSLNFVGLVFYSYTTVCTIIFLAIARVWPALMREWASIEEKFLCAPYKPHHWKLSTKVRIIAGIVIALAFFEHLLYLANSAYNQYQHVSRSGIYVEDPLAYFLRHQIGFIYDYVPFSLPFGILNEAFNMSFTFGWNYMELFVMMISIGISTRFQQVNALLKTFRGKVLPEHRWARVREDYSSLCDLVDLVDRHLRYLILLSNLNNVYFVCYQLLNIFEKQPFTINIVYFWFSLVYLACRTLVAQFMAAEIHDASTFPIQIVASIPPEGWCVEMERLMEQARAGGATLSGMKFFRLTRSSILSMIATIVTYELVLMQLRDAE